MPNDREFTLVAGWVLKIINSHEYWTPNPYTLILHNPRDIFREYAQALCADACGKVAPSCLA